MRERVVFQAVEDHRTRAEALYVRVREDVLRLVPNAVVEHVGSTSLPDGLTKGDLDVQVRVRPEVFDEACRALGTVYQVNPGGFTDGGRSFKQDSAQGWTNCVGLSATASAQPCALAGPLREP